VVVLAAIAGLAGLAGCGGGDDASSASPRQVLAAARTKLDDTTGVHLGLSTDKLPDGVSGVLDATGVGTHAPAFQGDIKVSLGGITATVPVVAVGGTVHAKLPFSTKFREIDPADYGSPDPARLMATKGGISSWLTDATGVTKGDQVRRGKAVVTSYRGKVPGASVASVVPSADDAADFDATFEVDDTGRLVEAVVTGPFYGSSGDVAYTVSLSDYGTDEKITAP
jgi:lipoprotein LprG